MQPFCNQHKWRPSIQPGVEREIGHVKPKSLKLVSTRNAHGLALQSQNNVSGVFSCGKVAERLPNAQGLALHSQNNASGGFGCSQIAEILLNAQELEHQSQNNVSGGFGCSQIAEILLNAHGTGTP